MKKINHVVLGGTFDHFHAGHRALLKKAFSIGQKVSIGVVGENLLREKHFVSTIESYKDRKKSVEKFIKNNNWGSRAIIMKINNIFGPTLEKNDIKVIVVSSETLKVAQMVNRERKKRKMKRLEIVVIDNVLSTDGKLLRSARIRKGEVDREGNNFQSISKSKFSNKKIKILFLPQNLREELRKPLGTVIAGEENTLLKTAKKAFGFIKKTQPVMTIAVGDIVAATLERVGFSADLRIVDLRSRRKNLFESQNNLSNSSLSIINNPGTISESAVSEIQQSIDGFLETKKKQLLVIRGEEDLLTLPSILLSPLNSIVFYGQINLGIVAVLVTEDKKKEIAQLVKKFA